MNLITLLGAAVGSEEFCKLLSEDPIKAARLLNITLTETELAQLTKTFQAEGKELCKHLGTLRTMLCKKPPCAYAVVLPGRSVGDSAAA